jgi:hypothetical protein
VAWQRSSLPCCFGSRKDSVKGEPRLSSLDRARSNVHKGEQPQMAGMGYEVLLDGLKKRPEQMTTRFTSRSHPSEGKLSPSLIQYTQDQRQIICTLTVTRSMNSTGCQIDYSVETNE